MPFFHVRRPSPGGTVELASDNGNVVVQTGARVDVSAAAGGDAGKVIIRAPNGTATLAAASLLGSATTDAGGTRGEGGRFELHVASLNDFSTLNTVLNQGAFDGVRTLSVRPGDVSVAAADGVKGNSIRISADGGRLDVAGQIDASGNEAGGICRYAEDYWA